MRPTENVASAAANGVTKTTGHVPAGLTQALASGRPAETGGSGESDPELIGRVAAAVLACRQQRAGLSLLLIEITRPEELIFRLGVERSQAVSRFLDAALQRLKHEVASCHAECLQTSDGRFAVIVRKCDRVAGVRVGAGLLTTLRRVFSGVESLAATTSPISMGLASVAMPARNFPAAELVKSARRCLFAAQAAGGDTLKSIEIY